MPAIRLDFDLKSESFCIFALLGRSRVESCCTRSRASTVDVGLPQPMADAMGDYRLQMPKQLYGFFPNSILIDKDPWSVGGCSNRFLVMLHFFGGFLSSLCSLLSLTSLQMQAQLHDSELVLPTAKYCYIFVVLQRWNQAKAH